MSERHLEAAIWDLDGVIADTVAQHYAAWRDAFKTRGVEYTREHFMPFFGRRHDDIIKDALGEISPEELEAVNEEKQHNFRRRLEKNIKAFPGAIRLIRSIKERGVKQAIASSAVPENIEITLRGLGITDCFQTVVYGTEVEEGKPSPQIYLEAARRLKAEPGDCVVVEDAIPGVAGARRAGMKCLAVTNSHVKEDLRIADLIVDSLEKVTVSDLEKLFRDA
jgi:beta-phosphoglucomutase family hydrolase